MAFCALLPILFVDAAFLVVLFLVFRGYPRKDKKKRKEDERAVYLFPEYLLVLGMLVIKDDYDG